MKLKLFILQILCLCAYASASAQSFTLTGKVIDENNDPVEFASVSCAKQGKMTMTALNGTYSLQLQSADSVEIRFSMIGYKTKVRVLRRPRGKQTMQVVLHSSDNALSEVTITGKRIETGQTQELSKEHIKNMPSTTGNAVEEMIQSQAGVSTHSELSSQYNVRGGSFDENSVEIFRPFLVRSGQQEGISVINPDMVEKIGFSTGGYEARYGDKMSSALNIEYRRPKRFEASATASMLGASAFVGMSNKKFSWSNGLRYKTTKYLLGSMDTKGEYQPTFIDYQTYLTYSPNKRWDIKFLGNISDNHYNFTPEDRETNFGTMENVKAFKVYFDGQEKDLFRTFFGALDITRQLGKNTSLSLLASAFYTKEQETYDIQGQYWLDDVNQNTNIAVGTYLEHARNYLTGHVENVKMLLRHKTRKHESEGALEIKFENVKERATEYEMRDSSGYSIPHTPDRLDLIYSLRSVNEMRSRRLEGYIMDTYRFQSNAERPSYYTLNYGLRFNHWSFNRETTVSPRASLSIVPSFDDNATIRLAAGLYYQAPFYKDVRDTTTVNGTTIATLNKNIKSQQSIQFVAGFDYRFKMLGRAFKFSAEAYYKHLSNLIPYNINNVKVTYYGENIADGYATGLDMKLYGEFVPETGSWVTLSLMKTKQNIAGVSVPLPTDQRWGINVHFTDYFPVMRRLLVSLKLALIDGLPFGPPHKGLEAMQFRAPAYRRADIGLNYLLIDRKNERGATLKRLWLSCDALNLFGISNVNSYYWVTDVSSNQFAVPNYLTGRRFNVRVSVEL